MEEHSQANVTLLLREISSGSQVNLDELMRAIYDDLRRLAVSHLKSERANHTLQPTALVHEVYLKLIDQRSTDWKDRIHFFAVASRLIRRILVDHARERNAAKRGGGAKALPLDCVEVATGMPGVDVMALDEAMQELAIINERQAKVVEMRFFGGLTIDEIAEVLDVGKRSVDRDWQGAKAWLHFRLAGDMAESDGE